MPISPQERIYFLLIQHFIAAKALLNCFYFSVFFRGFRGH